MKTRFDLEQDILQAWHIVDDILILKEQGAEMQDIANLAKVYEYKFQKLWNTFETMIQDRRI